jgi:purine-binding chemotaxis protein CheW
VTELSTFQLGAFVFGADVHMVREVVQSLRLTPVPLAAHGIAGLINVRGELILVVDVRQRLGLPPSTSPDPFYVVVEREGETVALMVDTVGDVVAVDEATFAPPPETLRGIARELVRGAYRLPSTLLLHLDMARMLRVADALSPRTTEMT